jgi:hypothetical protein
MQTKTGLFLLSALLLSAAGCKTTETKPVPWKKQSDYLAKVRDPRIYGFSIYQTPGGIEYRGGGRLHANQGAVLPMKAEEPFRPAVPLRGSYGMSSPVLLDLSTSSSWLEYDLAQSLGATPVGEREARLVKISGEEFAGCPSVVPSLRFEQLFIDLPLVNVRMATGPIGSLARGIEKPELKGVIGWEQLRKLKQIQFDYVKKQVVLSNAETVYSPDPSLVIAKIPLVKYSGACAVRGAVNGKETLILIDPAGDFEIATDGAAAVSSVQLDADILFSAPAAAVSPGGTRIGARLLKNYKVTICPQADEIYFEKPDSGKDK